MTWVKICGITNLEDALTAVDAGADALGFVFYDKSSRYVDPQTAQEIVAKLPVGVEKVGVFVGGYTENLVQLISRVGLTATQLHFGPHIDFVSNTTAYGAGRFPPGFRSYLSLPAAAFTENVETSKRFVSSIAAVAESMRSHSGGTVLRIIFKPSSSMPVQLSSRAGRGPFLIGRRRYRWWST